MLSLKETEYLKNIVEKEISIRRRLIQRLESSFFESRHISEEHTQLAVNKHKELLQIHVDILEKLHSLGGN